MLSECCDCSTSAAASLVSVITRICSVNIFKLQLFVLSVFRVSAKQGRNLCCLILGGL